MSSSLLTTSTSHQKITSSYEHSLPNTVNMLNSVNKPAAASPKPVLSSCSLTSATVDLVLTMPSSLLTTSTSHLNIPSNYAQSSKHSYHVKYNNQPCTIRLQPHSSYCLSCFSHCWLCSVTIMYQVVSLPHLQLITRPSFPIMQSTLLCRIQLLTLQSPAVMVPLHLQ